MNNVPFPEGLVTSAKIQQYVSDCIAKYAKDNNITVEQARAEWEGEDEYNAKYYACKTKEGRKKILDEYLNWKFDLVYARYSKEHEKEFKEMK